MEAFKNCLGEVFFSRMKMNLLRKVATGTDMNHFTKDRSDTAMDRSDIMADRSVFWGPVRLLICFLNSGRRQVMWRCRIRGGHGCVKAVTHQL